MDLKDLLAIRPEQLAAVQELALQKYAAAKLRNIALLIEAGDYAAVEKELDYSPAGDDYGCDNTFISFDELQLSPGGHTTDIGDVVEKLKSLQSMQISKRK